MRKIAEASLQAALPLLETVVFSAIIPGLLLLFGVEHLTGTSGIQAIICSAGVAAIVSISTAGHLLLGGRLSWITTTLSSAIFCSSYIFAGMPTNDWLIILGPAFVFGLAAQFALKAFLDAPESLSASLKSGAIQGASLYLATALLTLHTEVSLITLLYYSALGALACATVMVALILHIFGANGWGQGGS